MSGFQRMISSLRAALSYIKRHYADLSEDQRRDLRQAAGDLFTIALDDDDRQSRLEVYAAIGAFLEEKLRVPAALCPRVVYDLCQESDQSLLQEAGVDDGAGIQEWVASAKRTLLAIQVHYEKRSAQEYCRRIEIFFDPLEDSGIGAPKVRRQSTEEQIDRDHLPSDVRESMLRDNQRSVSFILYKREAVQDD